MNFFDCPDCPDCLLQKNTHYPMGEKIKTAEDVEGPSVSPSGNPNEVIYYVTTEFVCYICERVYYIKQEIYRRVKT